MFLSSLNIICFLFFFLPTYPSLIIPVIVPCNINPTYAVSLSTVAEHITWSSCSSNISIQSFCISCWKPLKKWELCWRIWKVIIWYLCQSKVQGRVWSKYEDDPTWKFKRWFAIRWINVMTFSLVTRIFFPPGSNSSSVCSPYSLFRITK